MVNYVCGDDLDDLLGEPRVGKLSGIACGGSNLLSRQDDVVLPDQSGKLIALVARDDQIDTAVQVAVRCQVPLQLREGNRIVRARLDDDIERLFHGTHGYANLLARRSRVTRRP